MTAPRIKPLRFPDIAVRRAIIPVIAIALALALSFLLIHTPVQLFLNNLFLLAIIISTIMGGLTAGVLAVLLTAAAGTILQEQSLLSPSGWNDLSSMLELLLLLLAILALTWLNRKEYNRQDQQRDGTFKALADNSPDIIVRFNSQLHITYVNPATIKITGHPASALLGKNADNAPFHPVVLSKWKAALEEVLKKQETVSLEYQIEVNTEENSTQSYHFQALIVPEITYIQNHPSVTSILAISRNITERIKNEEALLKSEKLLTVIVESTPVIIALSEFRTGRLLKVNKAFEDTLGYNRQDVIGNTSQDVGILSLSERNKMAAHLREHKNIHDVEYHANTKWGTTITVLYSGALITSDNNPLLVSVATDITERKKVEQQVSTLAAVVKNNLDLIVLSRPDKNQLFFINDAGRQMVGLDHDLDTVEFKVSDLFWPADQKRVREEFLTQIFKEGKWSGELRLLNMKTGQPVYTKWSGFLIKDSKDNPIALAGVATDITSLKEAEDALLNSEKRFRALADNISQLAWIADRNGAITWFNKRWYEFTGLSFEEAKGWGWIGIPHPDQLERVKERILTHVEEGLPWEETFLMRGRTGEYRWFLTRAVPIKNDTGVIYLWFGTNTDITDRKRAEDRARALQEITSSIYNAPTIKDFANAITMEILPVIEATGGIMYLVEEGEDGQDEAVLVGHNGMPPEFEEEFNKIPLTADILLTRSIRSGMRMWADSLLPSETGFPPWFNDYIHNMGARVIIPVSFENRIIGAFGFFLRSKGQLSEDNMGFLNAVARQAAIATERLRLYDAEHKAKAEAQEANKAKDQFIAMVSHELRNPLSAIKAGLHLLKRSISIEEPRITRSMEIVERNVNLQARLINDLLDLSRLQSGKFQLQRAPMPISKVVRAALQTFEEDAKAKAITIEPHCSGLNLWVLGDFDRLLQVVTNLISNSLKFTPKEGTITVSCYQFNLAEQASVDSSAPSAPSSSAASRVRVAVKDTGIGIGPKLLPQIFDMFKQGEIALQGKPGLGIGLALVKEITARHGGRVWAESEGIGRGSIFTVELPLIRQPEELGHHASKKNNSNRQYQILLVEDNPDTRAMVADSLTLSGFDVLTAASGEDGLEILNNKKPDLLLVDIGLPGMNGYQFLKAAHRQKGMENIPAFAVTGYGSEEDVRKGREAGFASHIVKPVDIVSLERNIREWLEPEEQKVGEATGGAEESVNAGERDANTGAESRTESVAGDKSETEQEKDTELIGGVDEKKKTNK